MSVLQLLSKLTPLLALAVSKADLLKKWTCLETQKPLSFCFSQFYLLVLTFMFLSIHLIEKHNHFIRNFPDPLHLASSRLPQDPDLGSSIEIPQSIQSNAFEFHLGQSEVSSGLRSLLRLRVLAGSCDKHMGLLRS